MNSKKANRLFLLITVFHFIVVYALTAIPGLRIGIAGSLVINELILLLPSLLFLLIPTRGRGEEGGGRGGGINGRLGFCRIKPGTVGMIVLFTYLTMPLTTLINAISMLFVDNVVAGISGDVVSMPFFVMLFLMAVYGPVCEEITFRGLMFRGYRQDTGLLGAAVISALAFGLIHMNFNQMPYAFVIGILLAFLVEATGSLWSCVLYHFIFNAQSVCLLYISSRLFPEALTQENALLQGDGMLYAIGSYAILAAIGTACAAAVLIWIAKHEGRLEYMTGIWSGRKDKRGRTVTLPFVIAAAVCIAYCLLVAFIG